MIQKRYEYWGSDNGKPVIKKTTWFKCHSDVQEKWQVKNKLLNEYREIEEG